MKILLVVAGLAALSQACQRAAEPAAEAITPKAAEAAGFEPAPRPPGKLACNREEARAILKEYCPSCHERSSPEAKPKALAVFDLEAEDWSATLSEERFKEALRRLSGKAAPEVAARFEGFVEAELAARRATAR